jgi:hypothetical protein
MSIQPYKKSEPRLVNTIFGVVAVPGPFADDFTRLNWQYDDHWSGESARYRVAGLEAYVKDMDGDASYWHLKDVRTRTVLAKGEDHQSEPNHFWFCLVKAEEALRAEVDRRKRAMVRR